jgi:flagellar protein FliO/FliZ
MRLSLLPVGLFGPAGAALAAAPGADLGGSVVQMLLGLALVIGLLLASLHILKRLGAGTAGGAGLVKLRGATAVGPRERVVLVEVADKVLVLGVAPGRITPLHTLDAADLPGQAALPAEPGGKDFQSWLKHTLERRSR